MNKKKVFEGKNHTQRNLPVLEIFLIEETSTLFLAKKSPKFSFSSLLRKIDIDRRRHTEYGFLVKQGGMQYNLCARFGGRDSTITSLVLSESFSLAVTMGGH